MAKKWDLRERTMEFAVDVFRLCRKLPKNDETWDIARQLRRSASSVAANYRAAKRAQSDGTFIAKAAVIIEEADESGFWLEFLVEVEIVSRDVVRELLQEANELVAIFTSSKKNRRRQAASRKSEEAGGKRKDQTTPLRCLVVVSRCLGFQAFGFGLWFLVFGFVLLSSFFFLRSLSSFFVFVLRFRSSFSFFVLSS